MFQKLFSILIFLAAVSQANAQGIVPSYQQQAYINVVNNGIDNTGANDISSSLINLATGNNNLYFPPGTYRINNSTSGGLSITGFQGNMLFAPNAILYAYGNSATNSYTVLQFINGDGLVIENLHIKYQNIPTTRSTSNSAAVIFNQTSDTWLKGAIVEDSPSAGILFLNGTRPKVEDVHIGALTGTSTQVLADGISFWNCIDPQGNNITVRYNGDDGLSVLNFDPPTGSGGAFANIIVDNVGSRGITVNGQNNVVISNFTINTSAASGIITGTDSSNSINNAPTGVKFSNGLIIGPGNVTTPVGNHYGIEYSNIQSAWFDNIAIQNYTVRGMAGTTTSTGEIYANSLTAVAGANSASGSQGFNFAGQTIIAKNIHSDGAPGYGIYVGTTNSFIGQNLSARNSATNGGTGNRAIWFQGITNLTVQGVSVIDDQSTPTGYILGEYGNTGGSITGINYKTTNNTFYVVSNDAPNVYMDRLNGNTFGGNQTTIGNLPSANANGSSGAIASITNGITQSAGATLSATTGSVPHIVWSNGTNWIVIQ